jgi:hypothetical protein
VEATEFSVCRPAQIKTGCMKPNADVSKAGTPQRKVADTTSAVGERSLCFCVLLYACVPLRELKISRNSISHLSIAGLSSSRIQISLLFVVPISVYNATNF